MKKILSIALLVMAAGSAYAQDKQVRMVVHPTLSLGGHWFAAAWALGNARTQSANNCNLLGGVGYRGKRWSSELLLQRQWSSPGDHWFLGSRSQAKIGARISAYHELSPFLDKRALYQLSTAEYRVLGKLNLGVETENVYKPGKDSLGYGPRAGYPLIQNAHLTGVAVLSYQFRRGELNVIRLWMIVSPRL